ncbi:histone-lysine N-methyltransferase SETMAR [Nephila pilipes]|uniref:Histone-lysine N-methyltransferase SETMAR n=1 Tax=Nephila pilipes TaxID=299642 RepID=A0A8X6NWY0_NEPPI|nr:histone-lysine N-methyltransferase SETMAR [Nephila pilipes]
MIAESLNMSVGSVFTIMTEDLKKKKLCARFVPHTLTTDQKEHRIASSEDLIAAADEDPNFLKPIVTGDESWCLEYDPETKRQSSEWTSPGKGRPMKVRASKSKTKTMLLVFFDSRGIIHHEFLSTRVHCHWCLLQGCATPATEKNAACETRNVGRWKLVSLA